MPDVQFGTSNSDVVCVQGNDNFRRWLGGFFSRDLGWWTLPFFLLVLLLLISIATFLFSDFNLPAAERP